ncbi:hypothetical protein [Microbacterium paulum]
MIIGILIAELIVLVAGIGWAAAGDHPRLVARFLADQPAFAIWRRSRQLLLW